MKAKPDQKKLPRWANVVLWILAVLILMSAAMAAWLYSHWDDETLSLAHYEVATDFTQTIRIVQLSDLHGHAFGTDNETLAALVAEQQPDLIAMTGDMLDKKDAGPEVVCDLIRSLQKIAPVYYCYGNHEMSWMAQTGRDLREPLTTAGAVVLNAEFSDIQVKGQNLRLGGFHGYYRYWGMLTNDQEQWDREQAFAEAFEDTDRFRLLLCHIPTGWIDWGGIHSMPVDLVLTGHYHGGQIRLPLVGGIYAPYVGFFPENTEGMYAGKTATAILSTGLGSSPGIPRINNPPQIVVVDLVPQK